MSGRVKTLQNAIEAAARSIAEADALFIAAGAGIGVDSGLPDFRGDEGFWKAYPALREEKLSFYDLAAPDWFFRNPQRAWRFYGHRLKMYRATRPHRGFDLLRRWADSKPIPGFIFTSNVDGQFQKAGFPDKALYECHGSISNLQCSVCCTKALWPPGDLALDIDPRRLIAKGALPRCPKCVEVARPNILMFGDFHWLSDYAQRQCQRYQTWKRWVSDKQVVTIEIGAGTAIPTVRRAAETMPGTLIRINPRESGGDRTNDIISIASGGLDALLAIDGILSS